MMLLYDININWDAVSAIGSWLGSIATFGAAFIALYPYFKRGKLYFTTCSNTDENPVLYVLNNKPEGLLLEKICFFAGPTIFKKCFLTDNLLEYEDDLISEKSNFFISPYTNEKITYSATRIIHDLSHQGLDITWFTQKSVRIVVYTNAGKIKLNTKIKTKTFIQTMIALSESYSHYDVDEFIMLYCSNR